MKITQMKKHNVDSVFDLESECFSVPWSKQSIANELENPNARFFVACKDNYVLGYIGMHLILDECYITNIAVSKKYRKTGVGSSLLNYAISYAKANSASFITLEVRESNVIAIEFYKKFGFKPQGFRKNFYENPVENGLIFTKWFGEEVF